MPQRQMHLVAYLKTGPTAMRAGGWRHLKSTLDDILHPSRYPHIARTLKAGCFDGCFFADLFGLYDIHGASFDPYVRRGGRISFHNPTVVRPAISVVIGESESIARERADYLDSLIDPELIAASSSSSVGADLTKLKDPAKLAELQGNQGKKGTEQVLQQAMKPQGLTLTQAAETRHPRRELVGTPTAIADRLQALFQAGVCDGFVLAPTMFPGMFEQFCRAVVPELQRRGIFRKACTGRTPREYLQGGHRRSFGSEPGIRFTTNPPHFCT